MKHKINIGCDPEFFITTDTFYNYDSGFVMGIPFAIPPIIMEKHRGVVPISTADSKHPLYIDFEHGGGLRTRYVGDGAAIELNYNAPFNSPEELFDAVQTSKQLLRRWLDGIGYGMCDKPVVNFDYKTFWTDENMRDERFMWSVIFGCDPDKDAFDVNWLCQILQAETHPSRYGGGHLHLSGLKSISEYPIPFVKLLALTAGNFCNAFSANPELEKMRSKYYGKPGKYRVQTYKDGSTGVEYRTPSNQWTSWDLSKLKQMFEWVDLAIDLLEKPSLGIKALEEFAPDTVEAITTANSEISKSVLERLG